MGLSPSADGDEGFTLYLTTLLKKGRSKTFPFLTRFKTFARHGGQHVRSEEASQRVLLHLTGCLSGGQCVSAARKRDHKKDLP